MVPSTVIVLGQITNPANTIRASAIQATTTSVMPVQLERTTQTDARTAVISATTKAMMGCSTTLLTIAKSASGIPRISPTALAISISGALRLPALPLIAFLLAL
jgi:hypothetical protein